MNDLTLIVGANGKTGGRVKAQLTARGIPVRAVSRSTKIAFDWNRPETWAAALDGVARVPMSPISPIWRSMGPMKRLRIWLRNCT